VVGSRVVEGDFEAFRWTESTGVIGLGELPSGTSYSLGMDVSDDGAIVVGTAHGQEQEPFRWTSGDGMRALGAIAGGAFEGDGQAIAGNGSVIVGDLLTGPMTTEAYVWSEADGQRRVAEVLADCGASTEDWSLESAHDVSADGSTIVGSGTNPDGFTEGWVAVVPVPAPDAGAGAGATLVGLALVAAARSAGVSR
jgi:uncharacterized membrane protein